jgi:hypothetical protein
MGGMGSRLSGVRTSKLETREIIENFIFYASVAMTKPCK